MSHDGYKPHQMIAAVFILVFCVLSLAYQAKAQPEDIELNNDSVFIKKKKPAVMFPHGRHMEQFDCMDCHHQMKNGENILDPDTLEEEKPGIRCQDCHSKKDFRFSNELDATRRLLMQAYHKQCISCHRSAGKGPRTCNGCHKK